MMSWTRDLFDEPIYCEAAHGPGDVIVPDSDDELSDTERHSKRIRIENVGQRYLRGHVPLIATATLKGPFTQSSGWVNPWASRSRTHTALDHVDPSPQREEALSEDGQEENIAGPALRLEHGQKPQRHIAHAEGVDGLERGRSRPKSSRDDQFGRHSVLGHKESAAPKTTFVTEAYGGLRPIVPRAADNVFGPGWLKGATHLRSSQWETSANATPTPAADHQPGYNGRRKRARIIRSQPSNGIQNDVLCGTENPYLAALGIRPVDLAAGAMLQYKDLSSIDRQSYPGTISCNNTEEKKGVLNRALQENTITPFSRGGSTPGNISILPPRQQNLAAENGEAPQYLGDMDMSDAADGISTCEVLHWTDVNPSILQGLSQARSLAAACTTDRTTPAKFPIRRPTYSPRVEECSFSDLEEEVGRSFAKAKQFSFQGASPDSSPDLPPKWSSMLGTESSSLSRSQVVENVNVDSEHILENTANETPFDVGTSSMHIAPSSAFLERFEYKKVKKSNQRSALSRIDKPSLPASVQKGQREEKSIDRKTVETGHDEASALSQEKQLSSSPVSLGKRDYLVFDQNEDTSMLDVSDESEPSIEGFMSGDESSASCNDDSWVTVAEVPFVIDEVEPTTATRIDAIKSSSLHDGIVIVNHSSPGKNSCTEKHELQHNTSPMVHTPGDPQSQARNSPPRLPSNAAVAIENPALQFDQSFGSSTESVATPRPPPSSRPSPLKGQISRKPTRMMQVSTADHSDKNTSFDNNGSEISLGPPENLASSPVSEQDVLNLLLSDGKSSSSKVITPIKSTKSSRDSSTPVRSSPATRSTKEKIRHSRSRSLSINIGSPVAMGAPTRSGKSVAKLASPMHGKASMRNESQEQLQAAQVGTPNAVANAVVHSTRVAQSPWVTGGDIRPCSGPFDVAAVVATPGSTSVVNRIDDNMDTLSVQSPFYTAEDITNKLPTLGSRTNLQTMKQYHVYNEHNDNGYGSDVPRAQSPFAADITSAQPTSHLLSQVDEEESLTPLRPFREFFTPPSEMEEDRLNMQDGFANTQDMVQAATNNPWTSAFKKRRPKTSKRVSFGLLSNNTEDPPVGSGRSGGSLALHSPPPPDTMERLSDDEDMLGQRIAAANGLKLANKLVDAASLGSQGPASSVNAMAEAFIAADNQIASISRRSPDGQDGNATSRPELHGHSIKLRKGRSPRSSLSITPSGKVTAISNATIDHDMEENLGSVIQDMGSFLEGWDVEMELKKASTADEQEEHKKKRKKRSSARRGNFLASFGSQHI